MNIEQLKRKIEELPKSEREAIMKAGIEKLKGEIEELPESEKEALMKMDIEELKRKIRTLPESEKEAVIKMEELDDEELEKTVGGLSKKQKAALWAYVVLVAGTSIFMAGYEEFMDNFNTQNSNNNRRVESHGSNDSVESGTPDYPPPSYESLYGKKR